MNFLYNRLWFCWRNIKLRSTPWPKQRAGETSHIIIPKGKRPQMGLTLWICNRLWFVSQRINLYFTATPKPGEEFVSRVYHPADGLCIVDSCKDNRVRYRFGKRQKSWNEMPFQTFLLTHKRVVRRQPKTTPPLKH